MSKVRYRLVFNRKNVKLKKDETSLVQIEAYQSGNRRYFSTKLYLTANQWNSKYSKVVKHTQSIRLNLMLQKEIEKLEDFEISKMRSGQFSLQDFDEYTKSETAINTDSFIEFMKFEIEKRTDLQHSTKKQHLVTVTKLEEFGKIKTFSDLTKRNIDEFDSSLRKEELMQATIANYHKRLKIYINKAIRNGIIERSPYVYYRIAKPKPTVIRFLTEEELASIETKQFGIDRLERIRDMFLFCCYTGLAYKDIVALKHDDIIQVGESHWIRKKRGKTEELFEVLLLPKPLAIIEKYRHNKSDFVLPSISNTHYNSYLKEIATLCGIQKNLTTHVARHTFATTIMLNNGASLEVVSRTLGHRKLETTRIYGHILDKRIHDEMTEVGKRLAKKLL